MNPVVAFVIDYCQRHKHPVNAVLHIFGVPAAFYGIYLLFAGAPAMGCALIFVGYLFQYLGHRAQGNEVGEVTLIKNIWRKLNSRG
ncbi:MAG TPA: Mpo1-like protein [Drouetiella sp.]